MASARAGVFQPFPRLSVSPQGATALSHSMPFPANCLGGNPFTNKGPTPRAGVEGGSGICIALGGTGTALVGLPQPTRHANPARSAGTGHRDFCPECLRGADALPLLLCHRRPWRSVSAERVRNAFSTRARALTSADAVIWCRGRHGFPEVMVSLACIFSGGRRGMCSGLSIS